MFSKSTSKTFLHYLIPRVYFTIEAPMMDTSYLTTQVTTIISQLHSIFDEIGVPRNEREARETEVHRIQHFMKARH